eukprot:m51a1_g5481 hypothetical protein (387) ;mRNA; r:310342-311502
MLDDDVLNELTDAELHTLLDVLGLPPCRATSPRGVLVSRLRTASRDDPNSLRGMQPGSNVIQLRRRAVNSVCSPGRLPPRNPRGSRRSSSSSVAEPSPLLLPPLEPAAPPPAPRHDARLRAAGVEGPPQAEYAPAEPRDSDPDDASSRSIPDSPVVVVADPGRALAAMEAEAAEEQRREAARAESRAIRRRREAIARRVMEISGLLSRLDRLPADPGAPAGRDREPPVPERQMALESCASAACAVSVASGLGLLFAAVFSPLATPQPSSQTIWAVTVAGSLLAMMGAVAWSSLKPRRRVEAPVPMFEAVEDATTALKRMCDVYQKQLALLEEEAGVAAQGSVGARVLVGARQRLLDRLERQIFSLQESIDFGTRAIDDEFFRTLIM